MSEPLAPFRLRPWFSPRPWGRASLKPWYSPAQVGAAEPIGEAWLTGPQCIVETGPLAGQTFSSVAALHPAKLLGANAFAVTAASSAEFPLLIKLLFPADKLSIQVHPDDAHAQAMGQPRGKTECWYVLSANPGAQIALGFNHALSHEQLTPAAVRAAIDGGALEDLLHWLPVSAGDMIFVDAGTVHAIGPGMVLLETQQTCDITFRMYDYGRPRELHIDDALRVMKTRTAAGKVAPQKLRTASAIEFTRLIQQQYFTVDRYDLAANSEVSVDADKVGCLITLSGSAAVIGGPEGDVDALPGQAVVIPANSRSVIVETGEGISFVHCWAP
jgi:mannose-6-phosphate isomerase